MKEKNCIIRPYQKGEEDYIADAHERIYLEEFGWGPNFSKYAKQVVYDYAALPKRENAEMWVAEANHTLIGSIMLQPAEGETETGQLRLFLVEKPYRGQGIGAALMKTALNHAEKWGFRHLMLWTAEPNKTARSYYAKLGFTITETIEATDWALDGSIVTEERWDKKAN